MITSELTKEEYTIEVYKKWHNDEHEPSRQSLNEFNSIFWRQPDDDQIWSLSHVGFNIMIDEGYAEYRTKSSFYRDDRGYYYTERKAVIRNTNQIIKVPFRLIQVGPTGEPTYISILDQPANIMIALHGGLAKYIKVLKNQQEDLI